MPRPARRRRVCFDPERLFFKPRGVRMSDLETIELTRDELEAIRLCYLEGHYQEEASRQMDISRQTLGRILSSANSKVADFLVNGKALTINGGHYYCDKLNTNLKKRHGRLKGSQSCCKKNNRALTSIDKVKASHKNDLPE